MSRRDEGFLARWSRRKLQSRVEDRAPSVPAPDAVAASAPVANLPENAPPSGSTAAPAPLANELPPLESLTPGSDFAPFMQAGVDPDVKGRALKTLFSDPALYPMDGLDVYIDDYSKADPLPEGWLERLNQLASLHGDPPGADGAPAPQAKSEDSAAPAGTRTEGASSNSIGPSQDPGGERGETG